MINNYDTILLEIARQGSFSKAAQALFVTPQAIMKHVNKIEKEIGFKIFIRSTRGISLTRAGERYLACVKRQQDERNSVLIACREEKENCLRLGFCSDLLYFQLSQVLLTFKEKHPDCLIRFISTIPDHLFEDLLNGKFDACIYPRKPQKLEGPVFYPLGETVTYCIVEQKHELAKRTRISYEDLKKYDVCIGTGNKNPEIFANLTAHGIHPNTTEFPPIFVCYDETVYLTFMKLDALPNGLVQIPFESGFSDTAGIISQQNITPLLKDFIEIAQSGIDS